MDENSSVRQETIRQATAHYQCAKDLADILDHTSNNKPRTTTLLIELKHYPRVVPLLMNQELWKEFRSLLKKIHDYNLSEFEDF